MKETVVKFDNKKLEVVLKDLRKAVGDKNIKTKKTKSRVGKKTGDALIEGYVPVVRNFNYDGEITHYVYHANRICLDYGNLKLYYWYSHLIGFEIGRVRKLMKNTSSSTGIGMNLNALDGGSYQVKKGRMDEDEFYEELYWELVKHYQSI